MSEELTKQDVLAKSSFGERVAEEEVEDLGKYFVETDSWRRILTGEIDVVYGAKGAGKSAIYALLLSRENELFEREIVLVPGENPRGTPAFRDLVADPPTTEQEFTALWKLYLTCLASEALRNFGATSQASKDLRAALEREKLVPADKNLGTQLRAVIEYVRRALRPQSISGTIEIDQQSGLPKGFTGNISFREPDSDARERGVRSVDSLLEKANTALAAAGFSIWILLDRLDVAFADTPKLEENALSALFHVYLDIKQLDRIRLKIFLRTDIWARITAAGFREASHITKHLTLTWDQRNLLKLIVSRVVQNESIQICFAVTRGDVLASSVAQESFFYRMFPGQVDVGPNKSKTLVWMLNRTADGSKETAPREVIHLLNSLRQVQIRRFEDGEVQPEGEQLFQRPAFKEALGEVSKVRLEQTLFAEFPQFRSWIDLLRDGKATHSTDTLAEAWALSREKSRERAESLTEIGFFERRGTREHPQYWVPFLYRDALNLTQGVAEVEEN